MHTTLSKVFGVSLRACLRCRWRLTAARWLLRWPLSGLCSWLLLFQGQGTLCQLVQGNSSTLTWAGNSNEGRLAHSSLAVPREGASNLLQQIANIVCLPLQTP